LDEMALANAEQLGCLQRTPTSGETAGGRASRPYAVERSGLKVSLDGGVGTILLRPVLMSAHHPTSDTRHPHLGRWT